MDALLLRERYQSALSALAEAGGGVYAPPRIIAVTKTHPAEDILPLAALGLTEIGENRAQEIVEKWPVLQEKFQFHCIGRLQTNKVKYIMNKVSPCVSKIVRESTLDATANAIRVGMFDLIKPVMTSTDGRCVATTK